MLISSLASCGDSTANPEDLFLTTGKSALTEEQIKQYQQRQVTQESYQKVLKIVEETKKDLKQQGGKLTYESIGYNKETKAVEIKNLTVSGSLVEPLNMAIKDFKDTKNISIDWYDDKNETPHFIKVSMHDIFIPNEKFLKTADGKAMIDFFEKLGVDYNQLNNVSDIAYEYDQQQNKISLAITDDFNKLIDLRFVTKIDSVSKQVYEVLGGMDAIENPAMLLGLVSSIRLEEIYLKIKLEKTIEEIFAAMPEKEAKEARKNYAENKNLSDADIKQYIGNGYSAEKFKEYRTAWINFLEQKKPLLIHIKPDVPLPFSALFSSAMMAQQSPKMAENFIEQLKLTISN
jgi:hypothetical protein